MPKPPPIPLNPFAASPKTRTRYIPQIDTSLQSSFEVLKKRLRLTERARSNGEENSPSPNDADLDEPQRQVVSATQAGANLLKQFLANQLHSAQTTIQALQLRSVDTELALVRAAAAAADVKQRAGEDLEDARLTERLRLRGWRKFRRDNGLTRKAHYAEVIAVPLVITSAMIVGDGIVNAALYMNATDGGLAAGAGLALLFSAINVSVGMTAGLLGLRLLGHVKPMYKLLGGVAFSALLAAGIGWNLVIARYRDDLARGEDGNSLLNSAAHATPGSWIGHASPEALGLMLLGGLIFIIAVMKGRGGHHGFTDAYISYKPVDLDRRSAEDAYKTGKDKYRAAVAKAYEKARDEVRALHDQNEIDIRTVRDTVAEADERADEVRDSIGEWIRDGGAALRHYREENRAVRTLIAPTYFDQYPTLQEMADGLPDTKVLHRTAEAAIAAHEKAAADLVEFERKLTEQAKIETENFLDEVARIEARVEERMNRDFSDHERSIDDRNPSSAEVGLKVDAAPVERSVSKPMAEPLPTSTLVSEAVPVRPSYKRDDMGWPVFEHEAIPAAAQREVQ